MTVELRILMVTLAVFAGVSLLTTGIVLLLAGRESAGPAALRARRLSAVRLLPAAAAAAIGIIVLTSFAEFEPRWEGEEVGVALPMLAAFAILLIGSSFWRGLQLVRATYQTTRAWLAAAEPVELAGTAVPAFVVDTEFPVVSAIGFFRPKLIIARKVLDSCNDEELGAILAHEQGHIDRGDNLRRLLIGMAPDVITWLPVSARLLADWRQAAEDAADDDAVKSGADGHLRLAQALVKVARLAPVSRSQSAIPASALYRGESLDRRVRRLTDAGGPAATPPQRTWPVRLIAVLLVAGSLTVLENIHGVVENLIHRLP
ncbi:MAG TPA: M56 family metallopeptidase [Vicinamibacterales bacterium]|nr:M56 family metallopeptidase [Vicinamibacterales bacterium]